MIVCVGSKRWKWWRSSPRESVTIEGAAADCAGASGNVGTWSRQTARVVADSAGGLYAIRRSLHRAILTRAMTRGADQPLVPFVDPLPVSAAPARTAAGGRLKKETK